MRKVKSLLVTLALLFGVGLVSAPAASADICHPDGSNSNCGKTYNSLNSDAACKIWSYGGWTQPFGGVGIDGVRLYPGRSSSTYHKDSDGIYLSTNCYWYKRVGGSWAKPSFASSGEFTKNWWGDYWHMTGKVLR